MLRLPSPAGDTDALVRLLTPLLRMMKRSPRFTVEMAGAGLLPVLLELLKKEHAEARRKLLQIIHVVYEHHPRPKELIMRYRLQVTVASAHACLLPPPLRPPPHHTPFNNNTIHAY